MTVKELREALKDYPDNRTVVGADYKRITSICGTEAKMFWGCWEDEYDYVNVVRIS